MCAAKCAAYGVWVGETNVKPDFILYVSVLYPVDNVHMCICMYISIYDNIIMQILLLYIQILLYKYSCKCVDI